MLLFFLYLIISYIWSLKIMIVLHNVVVNKMFCVFGLWSHSEMYTTLWMQSKGLFHCNYVNIQSLSLTQYYIWLCIYLYWWFCSKSCWDSWEWVDRLYNKGCSKCGYNLIPQTDFKFCVNKYICALWQESQNEIYQNKLHSVKLIIGNVGTVYRSACREVVLTILRLVHTSLMFFGWMYFILRFIPDCKSFNQLRKKYFTQKLYVIHDIFKHISHGSIIYQVNIKGAGIDYNIYFLDIIYFLYSCILSWWHLMVLNWLFTLCLVNLPYDSAKNLLYYG